MRTSILACLAVLAAGCGEATGPLSGTVYSTTLSGGFNETTVSNGHTGGGDISCTSTFSVTGPMSITIHDSTGTTLTGEANVGLTQTETGHTATCNAMGNRSGDWTVDYSTTAADFRFSSERTAGGSFVVTEKISFAGVRQGSSITGTLTFTRTGTGTSGNNVTVNSSATGTFNVTLSKN